MLWISVKSFTFKMVTESHWQFSKVGYLEESLVGAFFKDKWNWFLCSDDWNFNRVWWIHGSHTFALLWGKNLWEKYWFAWFCNLLRCCVLHRNVWADGLGWHLYIFVENLLGIFNFWGDNGFTLSLWGRLVSLRRR